MRNAISPFKMMIVAVLFSIGLFNTAPASAEWKIVVKDDQGDSFLDFDRIRKDRGYIYFWVLRNYTTGASLIGKEEKAYSSKYLYKVDCNIFRARVLDRAMFAGPMGGRPKIHYTGRLKMPSDWLYPEPDTKFEKVLEAACNH